jgi:hypothetical protein
MLSRPQHLKLLLSLPLPPHLLALCHLLVNRLLSKLRLLKHLCPRHNLRLLCLKLLRPWLKSHKGLLEHSYSLRNQKALLRKKS